MACGCLNIKTFLKKTSGILSRVCCVLLLMAQAGILDYYLVEYNSLVWLIWILADVVVVAFFIAAFILSYKDVVCPLKRNPATCCEIPLGYKPWGVYSILLCCKVFFIYGPTHNIVSRLDESYMFGPNSLKATVGLYAIIHLLLVFTPHNAEPNSEIQKHIEQLSEPTAIDILDIVQLLDLVSVQQTVVLLSYEMRLAIIVVACISLLLPTFLLLMLSCTLCYGGFRPKTCAVIYTILYRGAVNAPIMTMRFITWEVHNTNISVFIIKNIIGLGRMLNEIYEHIDDICGQEHERNQDQNEPETRMSEDAPGAGTLRIDVELHNKT